VVDLLDNVPGALLVAVLDQAFSLVAQSDLMLFVEARTAAPHAHILRNGGVGVSQGGTFDDIAE
jgi:hypothetical protein